MNGGSKSTKTQFISGNRLIAWIFKSIQWISFSNVIQDNPYGNCVDNMRPLKRFEIYPFSFFRFWMNQLVQYMAKTADQKFMGNLAISSGHVGKILLNSLISFKSNFVPNNIYLEVLRTPRHMQKAIWSSSWTWNHETRWARLGGRYVHDQAYFELPKIKLQCLFY